MNSRLKKCICYTICIYQLAAVLSCVVFVYLTVAVYTPAYDRVNSLEPWRTSEVDKAPFEDPVMCTTISNKIIPNCEVDGQPSWGSCGEGCLPNSSGSCTQIKVDVRFNGSNLRLEECQPYDVKYCDGINPKMKVFECINGDCVSLHGIFNCTKGTTSSEGEISGAMCRNLTSVLSCTLEKTDQPITCNSKRACMNLDGMYDCTYGKCSRLLEPYKCEKCLSIHTGGKSIIIREGEVIFTLNCARAVDIKTNVEVWPKSPKSQDDVPLLMMFHFS